MENVIGNSWQFNVQESPLGLLEALQSYLSIAAEDCCSTMANSKASYIDSVLSWF